MNGSNARYPFKIFKHSAATSTYITYFISKPNLFTAATLSPPPTKLNANLFQLFQQPLWQLLLFHAEIFPFQKTTIGPFHKIVFDLCITLVNRFACIWANIKRHPVFRNIITWRSRSFCCVKFICNNRIRWQMNAKHLWLQLFDKISFAISNLSSSQSELPILPPCALKKV